MKFILFAGLTFMAALAIAGQPKPVAHKFDEFEIEGDRYGSFRSQALRTKAERVKKRMLVERGKRLILIGYNAQISQVSSPWRNNVAEEFRWLLGHAPSIGSPTILDGGLREKESIEVWIAAKTADDPQPSPEYERSEKIECPAVELSAMPFQYEEKTIDFKINFQPGLEKDIRWRVVGGDIIKRSADGITVKETNGPGSRVTAFLEVPEMPMPCTNRFSSEAFFRVEPVFIDEFGTLPNGDLRARMDNFLVELQNNPQDQGVVHIYSGRDRGGRDAIARERLFRNHIRFRRFPADRITVVMAGSREEFETSLWRVVPGSDPPKPKPTLDKRFVVNTP